MKAHVSKVNVRENSMEIGLISMDFGYFFLFFGSRVLSDFFRFFFGFFGFSVVFYFRICVYLCLSIVNSLFFVYSLLPGCPENENAAKKIELPNVVLNQQLLVIRKMGVNCLFFVHFSCNGPDIEGC